MESLIPLIKKETISNRWMTKEIEQFQYDKVNIWYQVLKRTEDTIGYLVPPEERNTENCPIMARGIVAYLIRNWGRYEEEIFNEYYSLSLFKFEDIEKRKPGAFKRDLNKEHYAWHVTQEKEYIKSSEKIFHYLPDNDQKLIKEYLNSYFDFIKINYDTNVNSGSRTLPFSYYLRNIEEKDKLIEVLKDRYPTGKNKEAAIMLAVLYENDLITFPDKMIDLYKSMSQEWNEEIERRGIEKFLKTWWAEITMDWLKKNRVKLEYPNEVLDEIKYLKFKVENIKSYETK